MNRILIALLFCFGLGGAALADGRAFPPDDCSTASPFMAFDGIATGGNTYCRSGQDVMRHAIPACGVGQVVSHDGSKFYCKDIETDLEVPACGAGQFLTSDGDGFACASTSVPTCAANQVLTYNGSAFICVTRTDSIPTCAANQFLTYNGASFQCANTQTLSIPNCPSGYVLTGSAGSLACVPVASGDEAGDWCGYRFFNCQTDAARTTVPFGQIYETTSGSSIPCQGTPIRAYCRGVTVNYSGGEGGIGSEWHVDHINCPAGYYVMDNLNHVYGTGGEGGFAGGSVSCVRN